MNEVFVLALAIGVVAGLRAMIATALVAWAAHLGWMNLGQTSLAWMGSLGAVIIFSLMALGELIGDKKPFAPRRTQPMPLSARLVLGGFCAVCFAAAAHRPFFPAAMVGGIGAFFGAFAGYRIRRLLVQNLHTRDRVIAVAEDLITLGLAIFIVSSGVA